MRFERCRPLAGNAQALLDPVNPGACLAQLVDHGIQMIGTGVLQQHIAARCGHRTQKGARFDTVCHHGMLAAVELFHPFDGDAAAAVACDLGAHFDEHFGQIANFRLLRGIFQYGDAISQGRSHQEVFGTRNGNHVCGNVRAFQACLPGWQMRFDIAVLHLDHRTHGLQPLDVLLDRPGANGATAGQRYPRLAATRQQRPQRQHRRTHGFDQFIRRLGRQRVDRLKAHAAALAMRVHAHTHVF